MYVCPFIAYAMYLHLLPMPRFLIRKCRDKCMYVHLLPMPIFLICRGK